MKATNKTSSLADSLSNQFAAIKLHPESEEKEQELFALLNKCLKQITTPAIERLAVKIASISLIAQNQYPNNDNPTILHQIIAKHQLNYYSHDNICNALIQNCKSPENLIKTIILVRENKTNYSGAYSDFLATLNTHPDDLLIQKINQRLSQLATKLKQTPSPQQRQPQDAKKLPNKDQGKLKQKIELTQAQTGEFQATPPAGYSLPMQPGYRQVDLAGNVPYHEKPDSENFTEVIQRNPQGKLPDMFAIQINKEGASIKLAYKRRSPLPWHHSSLTAGGEAAYLGTLFRSNRQQGKLLTISNASGHYKPPVETLFSVCVILSHHQTPLSLIKLSTSNESAFAYIIHPDAKEYLQAKASQLIANLSTACEASDIDFFFSLLDMYPDANYPIPHDDKSLYPADIVAKSKMLDLTKAKFLAAFINKTKIYHDLFQAIKALSKTRFFENPSLAARTNESDQTRNLLLDFLFDFCPNQTDISLWLAYLHRQGWDFNNPNLSILNRLQEKNMPDTQKLLFQHMGLALSEENLNHILDEKPANIREKITSLCKLGWNPNQLFRQNKTFLGFLMHKYNNNINEFFPLLKHLSDSFSLDLNQPYISTHSLMEKAIENQDVALYNFLIKQRITISNLPLPNQSKGFTLLQLAVFSPLKTSPALAYDSQNTKAINDKSFIVKDLITNGADVDAFSAKGYTLSHLLKIPSYITRLTKATKAIIKEKSNPHLKTKSIPCFTSDQLGLLYSSDKNSAIQLNRSIQQQRSLEQKPRENPSPAF